MGLADRDYMRKEYQVDRRDQKPVHELSHRSGDAFIQNLQDQKILFGI